MATWKKIIVSGSNVSQLANDAGYLTSVTSQTAFVTASFNGTHIIANNSQGQLNFASSSAQGLTISADAGTDTLTFGLSAVPNVSLANSAITIAGTSTSLGGSISAATILLGTSVVSGSSLDSPNQGEARLTTNGVTAASVDLGLQTTDTPTFSGLVITNNTTIGGNLTVNGTTTSINTTNLDIEDQFVLLSSGSAATLDSGIVFGGSTGVAQSGSAMIWDASYNSDDGRLAIVGSMASTAIGNQVPSYHIAGVFEGTEVNAATAKADHAGNIRVESGDIFIYV